MSYPVSADPEQPWVPEAFGEAHLVNGKIFPYLDVEPRKYRFRILNAANGRFYRLSLSPRCGNASDRYLTRDCCRRRCRSRYVQLAPGERADLVIDFAPHRGAQMLLMSDAFTLMQFRVGAARVADSERSAGNAAARCAHCGISAVLTRRLTLDEQ